MIFSRTPVNKLMPFLYTSLFVVFVLLIFEQILQMICALLFPDVFSVMPFTLDIFGTEKLGMMIHIPGWVIVIVIILILISLAYLMQELLVRYHERQEELYIGDKTDKHLYQAIFTRPNVKYHELPIYTGEFLRDNKGTKSTERSDSTAGELYNFMHAALYSLPLDEVFYIKDIEIIKENRWGLKFSGSAITNKRNLLVKKHKKYFLSRKVNDYEAMRDLIIEISQSH